MRKESKKRRRAKHLKRWSVLALSALIMLTYSFAGTAALAEEAAPRGSGADDDGPGSGGARRGAGGNKG